VVQAQVHRLRVPVSAADWRRGPIDAPVTLVEYGDLQCPCCQDSHPVIEQVLGARGAGVRVAVRHFPVRSLHEYAEGAAMALEAAGRQGKFWEMYRAVMEARGRVRPLDLECLARRLDLDLDEFRRDMRSEELREKIGEQKRGGLRSGVNGTPTLFVNGVRYDGAVCPVRGEELREAVAAARREAARTEAG